MFKEHEDYLWNRLPLEDDEERTSFKSVCCIVADMLVEEKISSPKQALRTLEKWHKQGCYAFDKDFDKGWKVAGKSPNHRQDDPPPHPWIAALKDRPLIFKESVFDLPCEKGGFD